LDVEKSSRFDAFNVKDPDMRIAAAVGLLVLAQAAPQPPATAKAPAIPGVIAAGTTIELVKYPVEGTEGPVGMPDGSVLFTETRADRITRVDLLGRTSTYVAKSNGSNGLGFDSRGRLISVQRATGNERVGVLYPESSVATLIDRFAGKPFSRLNDLVVSSRGGVYFTDTEGVYYLAPGATAAMRVEADIPNPNGVMLSRDEKTVYANNKDGEYLLAYDVRPDGSLANRRNFGKYKSVTMKGHPDPLLAEDNGADGLAIDNDGRVYVATNVGVEIFSPQGAHLGVIPIGIWGGEQNMLRKPQNLTFAGIDRRTLVTVGANAIYRVRTLSQGFTGRAK
jgi:gluconolactonase